MSTFEKQATITLAGGRIRCRRCDAKSKRTQLQCGAPAIRGKIKCRVHGGRSSGPRTEEGKASSAAANLKHGRYTQQAQTQRSESSALVSQLEDAMYLLGMTDAPRCPGRKASGYRKLTSLEDVRTMLLETKTDRTS
jgi:hypothetical protein